METPDWIKDALRKRSKSDQEEPFLFHGTIENFDGRIVASNWESLRWFAQDPVIAQSYCPESGGSWLWAKPTYNKDDRYIPNGNDLGSKILELMGHDVAKMDITYDPHGRILSYRVEDGHPTWNDVHQFLIGTLGYDPNEETFWIKTKGNDVKRADWKQSGSLYIVEKPSHLNLYDLSTQGDGGLTGCQWMQTDKFKNIMKNHEFDGVKISDVHISPRLGQFEHTSIGLFDRTLKNIRWHKIPCVSFDPADAWYGGQITTPEYAEILKSYQ